MHISSSEQISGQKYSFSSVKAAFAKWRKCNTSVKHLALALHTDTTQVGWALLRAVVKRRENASGLCGLSN